MKTEYQFGKIMEERIEAEDADYYSKLFGEGSIALTELIKYCILNDIRTFASCKGHPEDRNILERTQETGYLAIKITDDIELAYFLASLPLKIPNIKVLVDYTEITRKKSISIEVPATSPNKSEIYFRRILEELKQYKESKERENFQVNEEIKKAVDYIYSKPSNTMIFVTPKGFKRVDNSRTNIFNHQVSRCPRKEETSKLHEMICDIFHKPKNVDELIEKKSKY